MRPKPSFFFLLVIWTALRAGIGGPIHAEPLTAAGSLTALPAAEILPEGKVRPTLNERVLVVINSRSEISQTIGEFYSRKRGIPPTHICRIDTSSRIVVSREVYENEIRDPLALFLRKNRLQDQILYIVTTRGVPAVIEGDPGIMGDLATVDSELTLLYRHLLGSFDQAFGKIPNPYFARSLSPGKRIPFRRAEQDIYLVTRLSGRTPVDALALIDRGQAKTTSGSIVFDLASKHRSPTYSSLQEAADLLRAAGMKVFFEDTADLFKPGSDPIVAYCAVVDQQGRAMDDLPIYNWAKGAIALLLGGKWSPRLRPEDDPENPEETDSPVPIADRLIEQGVAGTALFLAETGQPGVPSPQILFMAYRNGNNLAESFYLATRYLSWRQVVIGDPLLAPFPKDGTDEPEILGFDAMTGLPAEFYRRRMSYLQGKYPTGDEVLVSLLRAEAAFDRADLETAKNAVGESLRMDSTILESHLLYARILEASSEIRPAVEAYEKALELGYHEQESLYRHLAALTMDELNDPDLAEKYVSWLYGRTGYSDPKVVEYLGRVQLEQGQLDLAEKTFLRIIRQQDPPPLFALVGLGKVYLEKEELDLAEDFLKRAIEQPGADASMIESILSDIDSQRGDSSSGSSESQIENGSGSSSGRLTRRAKVLERIPPEYPASAIREGREGYTILRLFIDERGQLLQSKCLKGDRLLCKAAEKSVRKWKFAPKLVNGRPEFDKMTVVIHFKLEEKEE